MEKRQRDNKATVSRSRPLICSLCLDNAHDFKNKFLRTLATDVDFALAIQKLLFRQLAAKLNGVFPGEKVIVTDELDKEQPIKIVVSLQRRSGSLVPPLATIELSADELKAFSFPLSFQITMEQSGELIIYGSS